MRQSEVPAACYPLQCQFCGDWLAAPQDQTERERADMIEAHRVLCHSTVRGH